MTLRRTAMARRSTQLKRSPLTRQRAPRAAVVVRAAKTRRAKDTGPTAAQRQRVAERAVDCCERCGRVLRHEGEWVLAHSVHHRLPRGRGGTNAYSNLALLCGTGVTGCHGEVEWRRTEAYTTGWLVRTGFDPAEVVLRLWTGERVTLTDDGNYQDGPTQ